MRLMQLTTPFAEPQGRATRTFHFKIQQTCPRAARWVWPAFIKHHRAAALKSNRRSKPNPQTLRLTKTDRKPQNTDRVSDTIRPLLFAFLEQNHVFYPIYVSFEPQKNH